MARSFLEDHDLRPADRVELVAGDRPGLLCDVGKVLMEERVDLLAAPRFETACADAVLAWLDHLNDPFRLADMDKAVRTARRAFRRSWGDLPGRERFNFVGGLKLSPEFEERYRIAGRIEVRARVGALLRMLNLAGLEERKVTVISTAISEVARNIVRFAKDRRHADDREAYTDGKAPFVRAVLEKLVAAIDRLSAGVDRGSWFCTYRLSDRCRAEIPEQSGGRKTHVDDAAFPMARATWPNARRHWPQGFLLSLVGNGYGPALRTERAVDRGMEPRTGTAAVQGGRHTRDRPSHRAAG